MKQRVLVLVSKFVTTVAGISDPMPLSTRDLYIIIINFFFAVCVDRDLSLGVVSRR